MVRHPQSPRRDVILPGTGRGTIRRMVEGAHRERSVSGAGSRMWYARGGPPSTPPLRVAVPLPVPGRIYPRKALAARALISISAIVPPVTQLPPTHSTGLNASHSGALASVIPPVGQKLHW
jgi:hypothetical protein